MADLRYKPNVLDRTIAIICDQLGVDEDIINEHTQLTPENGLELIEMARLVINLERRFKITINDEDVCSLKTVGDMAGYVEDALAR